MAPLTREQSEAFAGAQQPGADGAPPAGDDGSPRAASRSSSGLVADPRPLTAELRALELELREARRELALLRQRPGAEHVRVRELIELCPDPYLVTDEAGIIRQCNAAAALLVGASQRSLIGRPIVMLIESELRSDLRSRMAELQRGSAPLQWRSEIVHCEGSWIPVVIAAAPILHDRCLRGVRWLIRDDSDHRAAEARLFQLSEELAARAMSPPGYFSERALAERVRPRPELPDADADSATFPDLLGLLSDEIRTSVAIADGYVELLRDGQHGDVSPDQRNDVEGIAACHGHVVRVLDDAMAIARLDAGHLDLALRQVAVDDAVQALEPELMRDLVASGVAYRFGGGDRNVIVLADPRRLHQVMRNLLASAMAGARAGGAVTVRWEGGRDRVTIQVDWRRCDVAGGEAEALPASATRRASEAPTGRRARLALAISRKLARAMGGDVTVGRPSHAGSTFRLTLPRAARAVP